MKKVSLWKYKGDINIGLYGFATDKYVIYPSAEEELEKLVKPENVVTLNTQFNLFSILFAGNSYGLVAPESLEDDEKKELKEKMEEVGVAVEFIQSKENALGNLILCNDKGAIISPTLIEHKKKIEDILNVEVISGKLMGLDIVGSLGIATNKGFLITSYASEEEYVRTREALKVEGDIGSVNYGSPFVKSGIIANSRGALVGENSTGIELGRITESLNLL